MFSMNQLPAAKQNAIVSALVEGNSLRATSRMCDVSINTVTKLLVDLGTACLAYHNTNVRGLASKRVQCDEIWAFVGCKDKNLPGDMVGQFGVGSVWTWTALDADTKLIASYRVGTRDADCAHEFMHDLAGRLTSRVQLTTDGHRAYLEAVDSAFGTSIDYAMLVKLYGAAPEGPGRYSPPTCIGATLNPIIGEPDEKHISTSYVERQNLTMRMSMRRFTRLTTGFSKKVENLGHAVALHFMHYNFLRVHKTLRVTPAMEAGLTDHVWTIDELCALLPKPERAAWGSKNGRKPAD
jgi:IS1 family transposase